MVGSGKYLYLTAVNEGIVEYDTEKETYHHFSLLLEESSSAGTLQKDSKGNVWFIGGSKGLACFNPISKI